MSTPKPSLAELPDWPRAMSLATAAAYLDLSPAQFRTEVKAGIWPGPALPFRRRGRRRHLWDRVALDAALAATGHSGAPSRWMERLDVVTREKRQASSV